MGTDLRHLQIEPISNLPAKWQEDLDDLREGYPFEAVRRNRSDLDRHRPQNHAVIDPTSKFRTIAAHFGDKLVGWMDVRNLSHLTELLPVTARFIVEELIQRNRDDIRHHLLEWFRDQFPDQLLLTWNPTQNRTARQFLQSQGFSIGRTVHHLGMNINLGTVEPSVNPEPLFQGQLPFDNLTKNAVFPGLSSLMKPELRSKYLRKILDLHRDSHRRTLIGSADDSLNVLFLRRLESNTRVFGEFLLSETNPQIFKELLQRAKKHLSDGDNSEYLELMVPDSRTNLIENLLDRGFDSLTKRMYHLDVPQSLQNHLEVS